MEPLDLEGDGVLRDVGLFNGDALFVSNLDGLDKGLQELLTVLRRMPNFSGSVSGVAGSLDGVAAETVRRVLNQN